MSDFDPDKLRDPRYRERFQQKLAELHAVQERNTFIEYASGQHLFLELQEIYAASVAAWKIYYEAPLIAYRKARLTFEDHRTEMHSLRRGSAERLCSEIEALFAAEAYEIHAEAAEKTERLDKLVFQAVAEWQGWQRDLGAWRSRLKEAMLRVWAEDYAPLKAAYRESRAGLYSDRLPRLPLAPDSQALTEAQARRKADVQLLRNSLKGYPELIGELAKTEDTYLYFSEFTALRERLISRRNRHRILLASALFTLALVMGGLGWFAPRLMQSRAEESAWTRAQSRQTVEGYQHFLDSFPSGTHAAEARTLQLAMPEGRLTGLQSYDNLAFSYEGELKELRPQGKGKALFSDSSTYEGQWKAGLRSGQGVWVGADGTRYQGQWVEDKRQGRGVQRWADGSRYEGMWLAGQIAGQGTMSWTDGSQYSGDWKAGTYHGQGTLTDSTGVKYEGAWSEGKKQGPGSLIWPNGAVFSAAWEADTIRGKGTFTSFMRETFSGEWRGRPDGITLYDGLGNVLIEGSLSGGLLLRKAP